MGQRTQTAMGIGMAALLLGALAIATMTDSRASLELTAGEVSRCINRICPITGHQLGESAIAVEYRGDLVGVSNEWAAKAWSRLPERQQREMYYDIMLPAHR